MPFGTAVRETTDTGRDEAADGVALGLCQSGTLHHKALCQNGQLTLWQPANVCETLSLLVSGSVQ